MQTNRLIFATLGLWALALASCAVDQGRGTHPARGADFGPMTRCFEEAVAGPEASGAAVAVFVGDEIVQVGTYGTVRPDSTQPVTPATLFRYASTAKVMTAVLVTQLMEEGRLSSTTRVADLLPELAATDPAWLGDTTVHDLLTQQSGLANYATIEGTDADHGLSDFVNSPVFKDKAYRMAPPGLFHNYANTNYTLAGLIVERLRGASFRQVMEERIFAPLGMDRTFLRLADAVGDTDVASGVFLNGVVVPYDAYDPASHRPAAGGLTSIVDLARFAMFLLDGHEGVLSNRGRAQLQQPYVKVAGSHGLKNYGYGLFVNDGIDVDGAAVMLREITHDGNLPGYTALFQVLPDYGVGVVALINGHGRQRDALRCSAAALRAMVPITPVALRPTTPILDDYTGDYRSTRGEVVTIRRRAGDQLVFDWQGQSFPMTASEADSFSLDSTPFGLDRTTIPIMNLYGYRDADGVLRYIYNRFRVYERVPTP